jgi:asparagine synthase (glutamine-hydrolysing)
VCGIVGILARNASVAPDILERATQSLAHRGPDDSGTIVLQETRPEPMEIGLGNRRLAILDLSPLGHQPMHDPDTGNWIVHNGEIYNFREIRSRLQSEGTRFAGHSDTEVLLKAYGRWGERCLAEFRGMFAFAIWDARQHRLFLARDPMGIKPLYYYASHQNFLFASEVRTLLGTGLVPRRLNPGGLTNYLAFGSVYDPNTLIEGISALRAGHYLVWEKGSTREVEYWDLARVSREHEDVTTSRSQRNGHAGQRQLEELRAALEESVRMQLVSDVPVGIFLSGGIDSSSLVALLGAAGKTVSTFSIIFREADYSEAEFSRAVAARFSTDHHEIMVSQHDALEAIPAAVQAMDQPTIDGLNTYLVSRHTRAAGMKVALSGLGGDELFAGYSSFRTVPRMERLARLLRWLPSAAQKPLASAFAHLAPNTDQNRKLVALAHGNGDVIHPYFLSRMLFTAEPRGNLLASHHEETAANAPLHAALARARDFDPINRVSYLEARCYMLNTLLRDADVMSMAQGLEVRVPLIDHRLAEQMFALPGAWKLDGAVPKPLLVGALGGALPEEIVRRPKRGFTLPFEHWLRDELRSEVQNTLYRTVKGPLASVLDFDAVRHVWEDFQRGVTSWSRPWSLCVLQRWCELHL